MGKLIRFKDSATRCWSRVNLSNGDPIWIKVGPTGVIVKKSRMGLMGAKLYNENNAARNKLRAIVFQQNIVQYTMPQEMTTPMLRIFTQVALESDSAAELAIQLNKKPNKSKTGGRKRRMEKVLNDYSGYIEHHPIGTNVLDISELPHPKEEILDAILWGILLCDDPKDVNALKTVAFLLGNFQENVGSKPLTPIGIDDDDWETVNPDNNSELNDLILKVRNYRNREKFESLYKIVLEEQDDIQRRLREVEEFKGELLEDYGGSHSMII